MDELREHRSVSLAVAVRASEHRHPARGVEPQVHAVAQQPALLNVEDHRSAADFPVALGGGLASGVTPPVGGFEARVHNMFELAAVIDGEGRRCIRQPRRWNYVATADFHRIKTQDARRPIDQALHDIGGLGPTGAAIGPDLCGVGEDAVQRQIQI